MRFRFIGDEPSEVFGFQWINGTEHEVTDEHAIRKLTGSALFETVGGDTKKPARPAPAPEPETEPEVETAEADEAGEPPKRKKPGPKPKSEAKAD